MKSLLKKIYFLTETVIHTLVSVLSVLFFSSFRVDGLMSNCKANYKKNNECIVMGNGPSITPFLEENYNKLLNKDVFAVNYFCSTKYFDMIKPGFYTLLDPDIFKNDLSDKEKQNVEALIVSFNVVSWSMVLFIPHKFMRAGLIKRLVNPRIVIVPFNATPVRGIKAIENLLFLKNIGMPFPQTVINAAIFLAVNLKYDVIHLYGVEQSWLKNLSVTDENRVIVKLPHFYGDDDGLAGHPTLDSLSTFLLTQASCFASHMRLQEYALYCGKIILNRTPGSYIDAYRRKIDTK